VRGCEVSRRSVRGYQAAVCVHVDTQSGCFGAGEADFALQTSVECRAAGAELVLVWLRCVGGAHVSDEAQDPCGFCTA
jgi:hypothetical protein